jgi:D-serine deaminase-like pyridoxal phosphate-dependent protein
MTTPEIAPTSAGADGRLPDGLDTPCLVVDLGIVERNTRLITSQLAQRRVALRPHTKTHKSVRLARVQLDAGAQGITVGNLGEAEVMRAGGIEDIFVAYPLWAVGPKAHRLRALLDGGPLIVGLDSVAAAERLAAAAGGAAQPLSVMIEVDPGNRRTGVRPEQAGRTAAAARSLGLDVAGVFAFGGHAYQGVDAVAAAAADEVDTLTRAVESLRAEGIESRVVSAGSTPTALGAATGLVTEIRAGTYLLGDRQVRALAARAMDGLALRVAATVVSTAVEGQVVIDAGAKILAKDQAPYIDGFGELVGYPGAIVERLFDYHGVVRIPPGTRPPHLGEVVAVLPNHACPVVNLVDDFVVLREGAFVDRWPVDARGRNG